MGESQKKNNNNNENNQMHGNNCVLHDHGCNDPLHNIKNILKNEKGEQKSSDWRSPQTAC